MGLKDVHVTFVYVKTSRLISRERDIPSFPGLQQSVFFNPFSNTADSFKIQTKSWINSRTLGVVWCVSFCGLNSFLIKQIHPVQRRKLIVIKDLLNCQARDLCHLI